MLSELISKLDRRTLLKTAGLVGVAQIASPFVITARAADEVKIGFDNPLTGTYAALGKNELIGAQLALEQINAKGGILGRKAELLVEDSTSGDAGTAVQKARKLIDRDKVNFLLGNVNSALAAGDGQCRQRERRVPHRARRPHRSRSPARIATGTSSASATRRKWKANAVARCADQECRQEVVLSSRPITRSATRCRRASRRRRRSSAARKLGGDLTPLGTTDFSSYLIKAQAANPDVIIFLQAGDDMRERAEAGGAVRPRQALPPRRRAAGARGAARPSAGSADRHLGVRVVLEPAERAACRPSSSPTYASEAAAMCRRRAPGSASPRSWTCALAANQAKSLEAVKMAKALQGFKLPPEVALMPDGAFFRDGAESAHPEPLRRPRAVEGRAIPRISSTSPKW